MRRLDNIHPLDRLQDASVTGYGAPVGDDVESVKRGLAGPHERIVLVKGLV
ncbi:MAG: hypothetical protein HOM68_01080 [Gemmatimonadetes bacterium]|jgi:hypothetical protein|nr:hypothetical protein [Gemmatimonadota bacterium]MBT5141417.1 hypothetical protein [Gemmatimonadota bacterium]MBT5590797.1 hypothetical protein [Gemmatimonadota bacterium]MBT5964335.1 hypothetical protein [Gemmatimonadota bacterium]MBT6625877.1 hypothetical protein [Gemmatimonadota bacterium]